MQTTKVVIIALVVIAVVLGILIYSNKPDQPKSNNTSSSTTSSQDQSKDNKIASDPAYDKDLTADEKALLTAESPDYKLATKVAVATSEIEVKDCKATPSIAQVKYGSSFTVKNAGTKEFKFVIDPSSPVTIGAGKSATIKADFKNGEGLYGYGCNNPAVQRAIGLILAIK